MSEAEEKFLLGDASFLTPVTLMKGIKKLLEGGRQLLKQTNVSGINNAVVADYWKSCFFDQLRNSTFLVRYYWSNSKLSRLLSYSFDAFISHVVLEKKVVIPQISPGFLFSDTFISQELRMIINSIPG